MKEKPLLLWVEDDASLGFVIQDNLREAGYRVHLARDGKEALQQFAEHTYALCVVDVMLPKKDGFQFAESLRQTGSAVPLIFVTARGALEDKARGFASGGDDYLTKPFEMAELLMRIEALLKRSGGQKNTPANGSIALGSYAFDARNFELKGPGFSKTLTKKEAGVLKLLCDHRNAVVERELITNAVWGDDSYFVGRSLDVFITRLRKYLSHDPNLAIQNVHGIGFRLDVRPG